MKYEFLYEAIKEAKLAKAEGEVPVGAVIVKDDKIIASAHNLKEKLKKTSAHAEMLAIELAAKSLSNWRLNGCEMYVTLEPCPMCAACICQSRLSKIYIGTFDPVSGACGSVINLMQNEYLKYHTDVEWLYSDECSNILKDFFKRRRV
ncbi:nucleoside deaminase [Clostridium felsineum]|uniref:nucleoside deaminase n=1 Tax=Clostridium felsineum TaxID=36839 RepID=UPI00098C9751|nr:nucleoside deaminase [Clostridium felsineum]MCR3758976.1 nucleoside deaminase [Clostridium felsineum]URZ02664.1 tRNA-specific adenosine deaminase [Clostridium felsineum]URZ18444.1 tRNA-specific adenosine deaminase [Clostridium felsineum DSM 794]